MKKPLLVLEIVLWTYTFIYVSLFGLNAPLWNALLTQTADPFALGLFNLMGLFPLLFMLDGWQHYTLKTWRSVFLLFGMFSGAYGITLFFLLSKPKEDRTNPPWHVTVLIAILVGIVGMFITMASGDLFLFVSGWTTDAFVGIMVVDFFALYALTIILTLSRDSKKGWLCEIPVIGYALWLLRPNPENPMSARIGR